MSPSGAGHHAGGQSNVNGATDHNMGMNSADHSYMMNHHHRQPTQSEVTIQVEEPHETRPEWGFDNYDFSFDFAMAPALSQSEMLAPMMAVENSWGTLLMPGYVSILLMQRTALTPAFERFRSEPDQFGSAAAHQPFGGFHQMAAPLR